MDLRRIILRTRAVVWIRLSYVTDSLRGGTGAPPRKISSGSYLPLVRVVVLVLSFHRSVVVAAVVSGTEFVLPPPLSTTPRFVAGGSVGSRRRIVGPRTVTSTTFITSFTTRISRTTTPSPVLLWYHNTRRDFLGGSTSSRCGGTRIYHRHPPPPPLLGVPVVRNMAVLSSSTTNDSDPNNNANNRSSTSTNHGNTNTTTTDAATTLPTAVASLRISPEAQQRLVYGKDDALFGYIEKQQQSATILGVDGISSSSSSSSTSSQFGHVLDAGTGLHSLRWLAALTHQQRLSSVTAITADRQMQQNCQREVHALGLTTTPEVCTVLYGNWFPAPSGSKDEEESIVQQLQNRPTQKFNVILADYLIGAMDGFVPYQQDLMIPQLLSLLAPQGRLYIVGLQPIPDAVGDTDTDANDSSNVLIKAQNLICRVRQTRDACILLAGHRCYREYPLEWILRQVELYNNNNNNQNCTNTTTKTTGHEQSATTAISAGAVRIVHSKQFPILYRHGTILKQINVGRSKLPHLPGHLRESLQQVWNDLEEESRRYTSETLPDGRIPLGFDYVVSIETTE